MTLLRYVPSTKGEYPYEKQANIRHLRVLGPLKDNELNGMIDVWNERFQSTSLPQILLQQQVWIILKC